MKQPTWTAIVFLCVCMMSFSSKTSQGKEEQQSRTAEEKRAQEIEELRRREIHGYGRVIDQTGAPVEGAQVLLSWEEFTIPFPGPVKDEWIACDKDGTWEFKKKAITLCVLDAKKDGYLFSRLQQDRTYKSEDLRNNRTSPTNRVILRLHKLSDPTFLVTQEGRLARATPEIPVAKHFDLFRKKTMPIAEATNQPRHVFYPDLEIRVEGKGTNSGWRVTYRAPGNGDGLIVTNALLFEAPSAGYAPECVLEGIRDQDFPRYLYLRTRMPAVYTRFDMNYSLRPDSCLLAYEAWTNPYSTRSLEPNEELEPLWRLKEQLTKDAKAEINAGRRLNKAELPKLIKEEKAKSEKK